MNKTLNLILMLIAGLLLSFLLVHVRDAYTVTMLQSFETTEFLLFKVWLAPSTLLLMCFLLAIAWWGKLDALFHAYFPLNAAFFATLAVSDAIPIKVVYAWISLTMTLPALFTWGYANQKFTFREATLIYPFLFLLGSMGFFFVNFELPMIYSLIAAFSLITWGLFCLSNRSAEEEHKNGAPALYWLGLALMAFGISYIAYSPNILLKFQMKTNEPAAFNAVMGTIQTNLSLGKIFLAAFGAILGLELYLYGSKWLTCICTLMLLLIAGSGLLFLTTPAAATGFLPYVALTSLITFVSGLIIEWFYFGIAERRRFAAKLLIGGIVFPLSKTASTYMQQLIIQIQGKVFVNPSLYCLNFACGILCAAIGLALLHQYGKRAEEIPCAK